jgi:tetratricopeptide (TPR) repeat protein
VHIDLGGQLRVAFLPTGPWAGNDDWPPELRRTWPHATPQTLVHVVATEIAKLAEDVMVHNETRLGAVVRSSIAVSPVQRPATPLRIAQELAVLQLSGPREGQPLAGWTHFEEAMGWLATDYPVRARNAFEAALELGAELRFAQVGRLVAMERMHVPLTIWEPQHADRSLHGKALRAAALSALAGVSTPAKSPVREPWPSAVERGAAFEHAHDFANAVALYQDAEECPEQEVALARCYLELGEASWSIDFASRALATQASRYDALCIRTRARLAHRRPEDALVDADAMVAGWPDDGLPHYLRGKCLLALNRMAEAYDALDRACTLAPKLLEAMLLRREAGRAIGKVRAQVGVQPLQELDVPAHLIEVRIALAVGDAAAAVAHLADPAYLTDQDAQLIRGHCLAYLGRRDEALAAFALAPDLPAAQEAAAQLLDDNADPFAELDQLNAAPAAAASRAVSE